jgi:hypothetical protein
MDPPAHPSCDAASTVIRSNGAAWVLWWRSWSRQNAERRTAALREMQWGGGCSEWMVLTHALINTVLYTQWGLGTLCCWDEQRRSRGVAESR